MRIGTIAFSKPAREAVRLGIFSEKLQDSVPDEIAERFLAHGSPSQILDRIEELREAGATHLVVQFLEEMETQMSAFSKKILPMISCQRNS